MESMFYSRNELAEVCKISKQKVTRLTKQGKIPCYRIGASIRYKKDELDTWLEKYTPTKEETTINQPQPEPEKKEQPSNKWFGGIREDQY